MPRSLKPQWLVAAKLTLDLVKSGSQFCGEDVFEASVRDLLLYLAIYIGHAEKRPMSSGKLSEYIGMPRPTVIRRLSELQRVGVIAKTSTGLWCLADGERGEALMKNMFSEKLKHIHSATRRLSIMDR